MAAAIACYAILYYPAATLGFRARRTASAVAASTFGTTGSEWLTGIGVGLANIIWYAVALDYAAATVFLGLRACGLVQASSLADWNWGPVSIKSPVYLATVLFWIFITGMAGLLRLIGVIAALMRVYAPVALLLLAGTAAWFSSAVLDYRTDDARVIARLADLPVDRHAASAVELIIGFFAMAALSGADWGAVARERRDVVLGGLTGVALAAWLTATLSLVVVAGGVASVQRAGESYVASTGTLQPLTFRWAVFHGIGGYPAGVILILFGLASLAPACYAVWIFSRRLSTHWPRPRRWRWTWLGGAAALLLIATSGVANPGWLYCVMGDIFAPALGAISGHRLGQRPAWGTASAEINRAGLLAWISGVMIALAGDLSWIWRWSSAESMVPASLQGYAAALVVAWLTMRLGVKRRVAQV